MILRQLKLPQIGLCDAPITDKNFSENEKKKYSWQKTCQK